MRMSQCFFYNASVEPSKEIQDQLRCRHYGGGYVGFEKKDSSRQLLMHGTIEEFEHYLKTRRRSPRDRRYN